jgi:hypothetical protein
VGDYGRHAGHPPSTVEGAVPSETTQRLWYVICESRRLVRSLGTCIRIDRRAQRDMAGLAKTWTAVRSVVIGLLVALLGTLSWAGLISAKPRALTKRSVGGVANKAVRISGRLQSGILAVVVAANGMRSLGMKTSLNRIGMGALWVAGVLSVCAQNGARGTGVALSRFPTRLSPWKLIWTGGQTAGLVRSPFQHRTHRVFHSIRLPSRTGNAISA